MIPSCKQGDIMYVWAHYENRQRKLQMLIYDHRKTGTSLIFITCCLCVYNARMAAVCRI